MKRGFALAILLLLIFSLSFAGTSLTDREIVKTQLNSRADLDYLTQNGFIIDNVRGLTVTLYVNDEERARIIQYGLEVENYTEPYAEYFKTAFENGLDELDEYITYEQLTLGLADIETNNPDICRVSSIGTSIQGRDIWLLEISANVEVEEDEPEFIYIANIHGNEIVGFAMMWEFLNMMVDEYGTDDQITALIDSTHIYIIPSYNPDGYVNHVRQNANGQDLNRSFPDWVADPYNNGDGREPEVQALIEFADTHSPVFGANFHSGAICVNYPYDSNPDGQSVYTTCPDDDLYIDVSMTYATTNDSLINSPEFENGITNGAAWYTITGGMQDWWYAQRGAHHVTIELANIHNVPEASLPGYWDDNRESMINYLARIHEGVRGIVTDSQTGEPLSAIITYDENEIEFYTDPDVGDYHRMLLPGTYDLHIASDGYLPVTIEDVVVTTEGPTRVDVALDPIDTYFQVFDFEDGDQGFSHTPVEIGDNDEWHLSTLMSGSGEQAWRCGGDDGSNYANQLHCALVSPTVYLVPGSVMTFWNYLDSEISAANYPYAYDAGLVEILPDGADEWITIDPEREYPYLMRNTSGNGPIPHDTPVFAGYRNGRNEWFDLSDFVGDVQFRFRFASDGSVTRGGWVIDDISFLTLPSAVIEFSALGLNFPETLPGEEAQLPLTIYNTGTEDLNIISADLTGDAFFSHDWTPDLNPIVPGDSLVLTVTFAPEEIGEFEAAIQFVSTGGLGDIELNGTGHDIGVNNSDDGLPQEFALLPPCPNPFNPETRLEYHLPEASNIKLTVYDILGRKVSTLVNTSQAAGRYNVMFNATNLASGQYFAVMEAKGFRQLRKLVVIK